MIVGLRGAARRSLEEWRINIWFFLHDNAPAHRSVLIHDFLSKNKATKLELSPFSPDLAPADYCLFAQLKSALNGRRFCDPTDITKNATEELKRVTQNGFQICFIYIYNR